MAVHLRHAEFEADRQGLIIGDFINVEDDPVTQVRYRVELGHEEAGNCGVRTAGKHVAGLIGECVEGFQSVDDAAAEGIDLLLVHDVVLVADVADEPLNQVLDGDDARGAAVLIGDNSELVAGAPKLAERMKNRNAVG